jgi:hypothetical protein
MKPNISKVLVCLLGFAIALPNLRVLVVSGVLSVNQLDIFDDLGL